MTKKNETVYRENLTANFSTHSYVENETSNDKIHQEVFEELHRKVGAKCICEVFRSAPGSFRMSSGGKLWGRERGRNWGEGTIGENNRATWNKIVTYSWTLHDMRERCTLKIGAVMPQISREVCCSAQLLAWVEERNLAMRFFVSTEYLFSNLWQGHNLHFWEYLIRSSNFILTNKWKYKPYFFQPTNF